MVSGLQRSAFNAATAFVPWRTTAPRASQAAGSFLQCGHGLRAVENDCHGVRSMVTLMSFNAATAFVPWRTRRRSPHLSNRRSFNAATAFVPWRTDILGTPGPVFLRLQCGHGLRAVENAGATSEGATSAGGFNAATAFVPWRTAIVSQPQSVAGRLQCGHGLRAVENMICN